MVENMDKNKFVTIGLIQNKVVLDKSENLKRTLVAAEKAANSEAQIICLQELYRTIYFPQYENSVKDDYSETIPGESTDAFCGLAKKYDVVIIVPIFEKNVEGKYYNSAIVIDSDGKIIDTYRKTHIPYDPCFYEKNYFNESKEGYKVFKTKYADLAVLICYDQWFPEAARIVSLQGAEIIFYPTAIGVMEGNAQADGDWHDAWETVMRGHAIANGVHVAAVNRVGKEDKINFLGQSFVCDAFGKIIKKGNDQTEDIIICEVDLSHNDTIREGWGFFKNRRPDTYKPLIEKI